MRSRLYITSRRIQQSVTGAVELATLQKVDPEAISIDSIPTSVLIFTDYAVRKQPVTGGVD